MSLVILLRTLLGYGKTQEMFLVAMRSSLFQLSIEAKQAITNAWRGMELVIVPPEHAAWTCFVSNKYFKSKFVMFHYTGQKLWSRVELLQILTDPRKILLCSLCIILAMSV